jgi:hypothetical protein
MRLQFLFILLMLTAGSFKLFSAIDDFQNFLKNRTYESSNMPIYIYEPLADQEKDNTKFDEVIYRSASLSNNNVLNLIDKILLEMGDIVCIQDILSDDEAYTLYQGLKKNYAHFLYLPPEKTNSLKIESSKGLLIVSKYSIKQSQFYTFEEKETPAIEGFFDFLIENKDILLGHIYATNLTKNNYDEKFERVKDKMQNDISKNEIAMPFILFGALNSREPSSELKANLDKYFACNKEGILLVRHVPHCRKVEKSSSKVDSHSGLPISSGRVTIKPLSNNLLSHKDQQNRPSGKEFKIVSQPSNDGNQNNQSGWSVEGDIKMKFGPDGTEFSTSVDGNFHDSNGNYVGGQLGIDQNGQGNVEVYGGHSSNGESPK